MYLPVREAAVRRAYNLVDGVPGDVRVPRLEAVDDPGEMEPLFIVPPNSAMGSSRTEVTGSPRPRRVPLWPRRCSHRGSGR